MYILSYLPHKQQPKLEDERYIEGYNPPRPTSRVHFDESVKCFSKSFGDLKEEVL
jgi:hypothetical protein